MEAFVDHLKPMLENALADDITFVSFGDTGQYLPNQFLGPRKEQRAIVALSPAYDRLMDNTRVASQEHRILGVDIIGFVNVTPDFQAQPKEAYGERRLSQLMRKIRVLLTQDENVTLNGRVQYLDVGNVVWAWADRSENTAIRGAAVEVSARVKVNRMLNQ
jgi:hypothetical protein